jgi:hypothetical protein
MHKKDSCESGVRFDSLPGYGVAGFFESCPCFGPERTGTCSKSEYPTAEERAAEDAEMELHFQKTMTARAAIVEDCGGPWKRGDQWQTGLINCPLCNQPASLQYSRASYNGHIQARCKTEGCVRWME